MLKKLMRIMLGDKHARDMKAIKPMVEEINRVYEEYQKLSDEELSNKTNEFRRMLRAVPRVSRINGTPVFHEQAEQFLERHPDVHRALFLGSRRDYLPADLVCLVILKEESEPNPDLVSQIREGMLRLSENHKPAVVAFTDKFPTTEGKRGKTVVDLHPVMRLIEEGRIKDGATFVMEQEIDALPPEDNTGITVDDLVPEAFAAVKEACRRHAGKKWMAAGIEIEWNMVPFDVQLAGAVALHRGNIAEMATGEGKTLTAIFALYTNALPARGAHLVTVNDYLSKRDSEWNEPIFNFLGMSVGCIDKSQPHTPERRFSYRCDITYGTNNEFGFDYLRDNMAHEKNQLVQRDHAFAIIDEVDSVLIDEARTPLIIAGPVDRANTQFTELLPAVRELVNKQQLLVSRLAKEAGDLIEEDPDSWDAGFKLLQCAKGMPKHNRYMKLREEPSNQKLQDKVERELMIQKRMRVLEDELYFMVEERNRQIDLTERGREVLGPEDPEMFILPDLADELVKVDQQESLEKEEKEKLKLQVRETYERKAEMLHSINQLLHAYTLKRRDVEYVVEEGKIVIVDENTGRKMPGRRWSDGLHAAVEAKENVKIEKETQTLATITIQNYFRLYSKLSGMTGTAETEAAEFAHTYKMDVIVVPSNVPTKRRDLDDVIYRTKREKYSAVLDEIERLHKMELPILVGTTSVAVSETISRMLRARNLDHAVLNAKNHMKEAEIVQSAGLAGAITIATNMAGRGTDIKLGPGVRDSRTDPDTGDEWLGGLQIIGTERHESRRIDRQLRGRAGRQGDPGTSRFFVSLEDDLMLWFGSERISTWMGRLGLQEGEPIAHPWVTKAIQNAQKKVEGINQERRKRTLEYDDVMNKQRETVYGLRRDILLEEDLREVMLDIFADAIEETFKAEYTGANPDPNQWEVSEFLDWIQRVLFMVDISELREKTYTDIEDLLEDVMGFVVDAYDEKAESLGPQMAITLGRYIVLRTLDSEWQDHLLAIDGLRESVGLRGYGQKDPLVEFTRDASSLFTEMLLTTHKEIFDRYFRYQVVTPEEQAKRRAQAVQYQKPAVVGAAAAVGAAAQAQAQQQQAKAPSPGSQLGTYRRDIPKVGRNEACPCGSGKKYKECHGAPGLRESRQHTLPENPPED